MGDIAIVGMSCVFPGASNIGAFWHNILNKRCSIGDPPEGWGGEYAFDPDSTENDSIYCKRGGYLGDLSRFDPLKYGIMPAAVDGAEPEHFLALRVADEALRDAGYPDVPINKERTEVILGRGTYVNRALMNLHQHGFVIHQTLDLIRELIPGYTDAQMEELKKRLKEKLPPFNPVTAPGIVSSIMSGRVANRLDLKGENYTIDAACASSLLAVDNAVKDLRSGRCDAAIAGGVQLSGNSLVLMVFSQLGALSRRSELRPLDACADGTMLGEGVGMVVLKRLEDAERDGNRIYSLIKGVGTSSDGRAKSVVAPRPEGEELAIRRAYEQTGINTATVGLVEVHGTAIPLGDVTEVQSLARVFGEGNGAATCAIGTVKSMIGHLIPASGIAAIIKTSLALYHRVLPPTICESPNPALGLEKTPFYINTETRPWIQGPGQRRRAGINAFGFGGINAHAILEEHVGHKGQESPLGIKEWDTELCVLSSDSREGLIAKAESLRVFIEGAKDGLELKDIAYTINSEEKKGRTRLSIIASGTDELLKKLTYAIERLKDPSCARIKVRSGIFYFSEPLADKGKVAFVFPGEGSQYVNMLSDLCLHFSEIRSVFDLVDGAAADEGMDRPLSSYLYPPPLDTGDDGSMWRMDIAVQSVTTANRALFKMFQRLDVNPHVVVGHSSGEFGALEASGAISLSDDKDILRYVRAGIKSVKGVSTEAEALDRVTLLAVGSGDRDAVREIENKSGGAVRISMDNCPYQIILCCEQGAVEKTKEELNSAGITYTTLPFHRAYHTPAFERACGPLKSFFDSLDIVPPKIPIYSCAYAALFPGTSDEIREVAVDQWARSVRFRDTIEAMYEDGVRIFVEVGPGGNLTAFVNDILRGRPFMAMPSNVKHMSGMTALHHALGMMAAHGVDMNMEYLYAARPARSIDLRGKGGLAEEDKEKEREAPRLSLVLPRIYLEEDEARALRVKTVQGGQAGPAAAATSLPVGLSKDDGSYEGGQRGSGPSVMEEYLRSQEEFLGHQEEVMKAYLKARTHVHGVGGGSLLSTAVLEDNASESLALSGADTLPFIGEVEVLRPGQEVVVRRILDIDKDVFILHHVLGGRISKADEGLRGLPVMPLTMSMEMMAEAASVLFTGKILVGMKDFRAYRWITLDKGTLGLKMHVRRLNELEACVTISEADSGKALPMTRILEGTMVFAESYGDAPVADSVALKEAKPSRFTPSQMYKTGMFSGPTFQAVERVKTWGCDGAVATLRAMPVDRLFSFINDPKFLTDPIILDAAGQVAAHWNAEVSPRGFNFFPYRFRELRIFGANPVAPQTVECRLRIKPIGESTFTSDFDIVGSDGRVLMEMKGWEDKSFDLPETFYGIRYGVSDIVLGDSWPAPVALMGDKKDTYECRRISGFPVDILTGHGKVWLKVLARQILSAAERERWSAFTDMTERRRVEWLLGRGAAKDAVRALTKRLSGVELCPADIEIVTDKQGRPSVNILWKGSGGGPVCSVSIAHTSGVVAALASAGDEGRNPGIDIEPVRPLDKGFVEFIASPEEIELFSGIEKGSADQWWLRLWCAKEAVAKALGTGLGGRPKSLAARRVEFNTGIIDLEVTEGLSALKDGIDGVRIAARTFVENGLVTAVSEY